MHIRLYYQVLEALHELGFFKKASRSVDLRTQ